MQPQTLNLVPMPTMPLPIDPSGAYSNVPTVAEWGSRIGFAGGINAPKVLQVNMRLSWGQPLL